MQGLLETPGLTVAGHLVHGQVKEAPYKLGGPILPVGWVSGPLLGVKKSGDRTAYFTPGRKPRARHTVKVR